MGGRFWNIQTVFVVVVGAFSLRLFCLVGDDGGGKADALHKGLISCCRLPQSTHSSLTYSNSMAQQKARMLRVQNATSNNSMQNKIGYSQALNGFE